MGRSRLENLRRTAIKLGAATALAVSAEGWQLTGQVLGDAVICSQYPYRCTQEYLSSQRRQTRESDGDGANLIDEGNSGP